MYISDMLRSPLITDENWKNRVYNYLYSIKQLELALMKQVVKRKEDISATSNKVDYYDIDNQKIITYIYNKTTGNRDETEFPSSLVKIEKHFDESARNSDLYLDCSSITIYDGRPDSVIKRVALFFNGDGAVSFGVHEIVIHTNEKQLHAFYNADGVLQPNGVSSGFDETENKKIILYNAKYGY